MGGPGAWKGWVKSSSRQTRTTRTDVRPPESSGQDGPSGCSRTSHSVPIGSVSSSSSRLRSTTCPGCAVGPRSLGTNSGPLHHAGPCSIEETGYRVRSGHTTTFIGRVEELELPGEVESEIRPLLVVMADGATSRFSVCPPHRESEL